MIKVVVAEDDSFSNLLLQRVLKTWGFEPVAFQEGRGALAALTAPDGPPFALLDWYLPGMDGIEICKAVRETQGIGFRFIIMLTANTNPDSPELALREGADVFLHKPINFENLFEHLEKAKHRWTNWDEG